MWTWVLISPLDNRLFSQDMGKKQPYDAHALSLVSEVAPYFQPPPGDELSVGEREVARSQKHKDPELFQGYIRVNPPKGSCFFIQRSLGSGRTVPDTKVCKKTTLAWQLRDLDDRGRITWMLRRDYQDPGVILRWPTPYRKGKAVIIGHKVAGYSYNTIVRSCRYEQSAAQGRRVHLQLFGGEKYVLRFPMQDQALPQPKEFPNLYMQGEGSRKGGINSTGMKSLFRLAEEKEAARRRQEEDVYGVPPRKLKPRAAKPRLDYWEIHPRGAFSVQGSLFMADSSLPEGGNTECRYAYGGYKGDPEVGHVECQITSKYQWIYLPLSCLKSASQEVQE